MKLSSFTTFAAVVTALFATSPFSSAHAQHADYRNFDAPTHAKHPAPPPMGESDYMKRRQNVGALRPDDANPAPIKPYEPMAARDNLPTPEAPRLQPMPALEPGTPAPPPVDYSHYKFSDTPNPAAEGKPLPHHTPNMHHAEGMRPEPPKHGHDALAAHQRPDHAPGHPPMQPPMMEHGHDIPKGPDIAHMPPEHMPPMDHHPVDMAGVAMEHPIDMAAMKHAEIPHGADMMHRQHLDAMPTIAPGDIVTGPEPIHPAIVSGSIVTGPAPMHPPIVAGDIVTGPEPILPPIAPINPGDIITGSEPIAVIPQPPHIPHHQPMPGI